MKRAIILTIKIIGVLVATIIIGILFYVGFYKWRQSRQYNQRITIKAYYMRYACGDCSLDMKVETVDDPEYNFIVGHDVFPKPATKGKEEKLCDYVSAGCYNYMSASGDADCTFELTGYLHKYGHGLPFLDCSETPYFTVEKTRFRNNREWINF